MFAEGEVVAGLALHGKKGHIVPLLDAANARVCRRVSRAVASLVPPWAGFHDSDSARYMGFAMGPGGGRTMWEGCVAKWIKRARHLVAQAVPAEAAARLYNQSVLPMVGYIAQLAEPPLARLRALERVEVGRIWHLPGNTLSVRAHLELGARGVPGLRSVEAFCLAAMGRAAMQMVPRWPDLLRRLQLPEDEVSLAAFARGTLNPTGWDTRPMAESLREVALGSVLPQDSAIWWRGLSAAGRGAAGGQRRLVVRIERTLRPRWATAAATRGFAFCRVRASGGKGGGPGRCCG